MKRVLVPIDQINRLIVFIRGQKVILDSDLAKLYGVETKILNRAVQRNCERFPTDFMFRLTPAESDNLRFQIDTSSFDHGGRRYLPYVFTEQGVAMLSSVLRSDRAVKVNIEIMRAFVKLRALLSTHRDLALKLEKLEKKYDSQFRSVFEAIRQLMTPPEPERQRIGFQINRKNKKSK